MNGIELRSDLEVHNIVQSFKLVFKYEDMNRLTRRAYLFIMTASGFIAHYDIHGFRNEYSNVYSLCGDIMKYQDSNQFTNFHKGETNYDYFMQRKEIYNKIVDLIV